MRKSHMKSFTQFKENREIIEFGKKFNNLCWAICESGMSFDQFWQEHGLPYLLSKTASTEEELMEGLDPRGWDWQGLWNGMKNSPTGQAIGATGQALGGAAVGAAKGFAGSQLGQNVNNFFNPQQTGQPAATGPQQTGFPMGNPATGTMAQQNQLPPDAQQRASKAMDNIKQQFVKSMTGVVNQYMKDKDSVGYQLAKGFLDKVNLYADKLKITKGQQGFDPNAVFDQQTQVQPSLGTNTQQPQAMSQTNV